MNYSFKWMDESKPSKAGEYCILAERIKTLIPQYANFDGNNWVDIPPFFLKEGGRLGFYE